MIDEAIAKHQQAQPGEYDDIVSRMLAGAPTTTACPSTSCAATSGTLIFAGQGGYFVPLTLMTMVLGQHPELQERAREEVLAVSPDGPITMEQIDADGVPRPALEGGAPLLRDELRDLLRQGQGGHRDRRVPHPRRAGGDRRRSTSTCATPMSSTTPTPSTPTRFTPEREAALAPGSYVPHGDGRARPPPLPGRGHRHRRGEDLPDPAAARARLDAPAQDLTLTNELFPLPASGLKVELLAAANAKDGRVKVPQAARADQADGRRRCGCR